MSGNATSVANAVTALAPQFSANTALTWIQIVYYMMTLGIVIGGAFGMMFTYRVLRERGVNAGYKETIDLLKQHQAAQDLRLEDNERQIGELSDRLLKQETINAELSKALSKSETGRLECLEENRDLRQELREKERELREQDKTITGLKLEIAQGNHRRSTE